LVFYLMLTKEKGLEPERARPLLESPVDFRAGSGPSRLNEEAQDGRCERSEQLCESLRPHHKVSEKGK